ncbi:MAG: hypothetical protein R6V08_04310 [Desulfuromonadales bacterium]
MKLQLLKSLDSLLGGLLIRAIPSATPSAGKRSPGSILLIWPGGIGDAILLLPAIRALKETFPGAAIDLLAEKRNGQGIAFSPHVRKVYLYDRGVDLLKVLRRRYDAVIDTEQWHRLSAVVSRLIRSPLKIDFGTNERKRGFTHVWNKIDPEKGGS